mmetsp:Transcript_76989/g.164962  ORF Transcript_76989/g.164962 Transcript_76989/m.164962 type:complete len:239 (+) Transcript_76989:755-1471(+)
MVVAKCGIFFTFLIVGQYPKPCVKQSGSSRAAVLVSHVGLPATKSARSGRATEKLSWMWQCLKGFQYVKWVQPGTLAQRSWQSKRPPSVLNTVPSMSKGSYETFCWKQDVSRSVVETGTCTVTVTVHEVQHFTVVVVVAVADVGVVVVIMSVRAEFLEDAPVHPICACSQHHAFLLSDQLQSRFSCPASQSQGSVVVVDVADVVVGKSMWPSQPNCSCSQHHAVFLGDHPCLWFCSPA